MKRTLLALALLCSFQLSLFAAAGGPDAYGYTWKDSNEPGGPAYSWWDISVIGIKVHPYLGDDNVSLIAYNFGTNFTYYWYPVNQCYVSSNGYITFHGDNIASPFPVIPSTAGADNFIAPMMSDLNFSGAGNPGQCYFYQNADSVCISWINVPFWDQFAGFSGSNTFQVILNKVDNSITFNYQNQSGVTQNNDITIGIENINGAIGLQHSKNAYPALNYTVKYSYPLNPTLQVTDAAALWNNNSKNKGVFIKRGGPVYPLVADVGNVGNQNLPAFALTGTVTNAAGNQVVNTTSLTNPMLPGHDTTITYSQSFIPSSAGTYSFRTAITGVTNDTTTSNNTITQEVVSVDTAFSTISLSYAGTAPNGAGISWSGGNGGIGVYFKPPTGYPSKLISTRYIVTSNPNNAGFYAKIYADDGQFGAPGTLIDSVSVSSAQIIVGGSTIVPLSQPRMIYSGGVYVLWYMNGQNITIGNDITGPFSYQTYEVLGNIWSEYRAHEKEDFFIGLDYKRAVIEDAGVPRVTSPAPNSTITAPTPVKAYVRNYGAGPESTFTVSYQYGANPAVAQTYSGAAIAPGDSVLFTFTTPLSFTTDQTNSLCVWTYKSTDFNTANDQSCIAVTTSTVGIDEADATSGVMIYPNPAVDHFTIEFNQGTNPAAVLELYDIIGKKIYSESLDKGLKRYTVNMRDLPAGVYIYKLRSEGHERTGKIIKSAQ
jgi:hypothetical protein